MPRAAPSAAIFPCSVMPTIPSCLERWSAPSIPQPPPNERRALRIGFVMNICVFRTCPQDREGSCLTRTLAVRCAELAATKRWIRGLRDLWYNRLSRLAYGARLHEHVGLLRSAGRRRVYP